MDLPVVPADPTVGNAEFLELPAESYSDRQFYTVRNRLLAVLRDFGTVGPMGDSFLDSDTFDGPIECEEPDFYVVDDRWNATQMVIRVEVAPEFLAGDVLLRTARMLESFPSWAITFALFRAGEFVGGVTVLADRVMVAGAAFESCSTLAQVASVCSALAS